MASYKQLKEFTETDEKIPKNTILVPDWLIWMFQYIDFWTLVSRIEQSSCRNSRQGKLVIWMSLVLCRWIVDFLFPYITVQVLDSS